MAFFLLVGRNDTNSSSNAQNTQTHLQRPLPPQLSLQIVIDAIVHAAVRLKFFGKATAVLVSTASESCLLLLLFHTLAHSIIISAVCQAKQIANAPVKSNRPMTKIAQLVSKPFVRSLLCTNKTTAVICPSRRLLLEVQNRSMPTPTKKEPKVILRYLAMPTFFNFN